MGTRYGVSGARCRTGCHAPAVVPSFLAPIMSLVLGPGGAVARPADDGYRAAIRTIGTADATAMVGVSWHRGCPVPIADLRRVELTHWGFDGARHRGEL